VELYSQERAGGTGGQEKLGGTRQQGEGRLNWTARRSQAELSCQKGAGGTGQWTAREGRWNWTAKTLAFLHAKRLWALESAFQCY
jgi:hypothetical protein